jgi:hypothetical protein
LDKPHLQLGRLVPPADRTTLILALGIRLILAPFTGHPFDLPIWFETGNAVAQLRSPYDLLRPIGYAGIWPLWLGASSVTTTLISPGNQALFDLLIKLPIIATDFFIPTLIVKLLNEITPGSKLSSSTASRISRSYLLNPLVIIAGSVWAMPDSIIAAGILLALLEARRVALAGFAYAFSTLLKPYPIILLPPVLRYFRRKGSRFALSFLATTGVGVVIPVILLRINLGRLFEVLASQAYRLPSGISPLAITSNLISQYPEIFTVQGVKSLIEPWPVRFLWIEALLALTVLLMLTHRPTGIPGLVAWMRIFATSYYLLFEAVSEQTLIPFAVLCMLDTDSTGYLEKRSTYWLLSAIVTAFLSLNVPIWRFLYPIIEITISGPIWGLFQTWGMIVLRILFVIVMIRDARVSWKVVRKIDGV